MPEPPPQHQPPSGSSPGGYPSGPPTGPPSGPPTGPRGHGGDDQGDGRAGGRRRTATAVAAVVAVVALVGATVAFVGTDGGDDEPDASATTDPEGPTSTEEPGATGSTVPPGSEDDLLAIVDELQGYVEEARGLEFSQDVVVELADDTAFEARLLEQFEEDVEDIEKAEGFYRSLGLLEPDRSLVDELRDIYSAGVLGFYDPESDELVVRGVGPSPYVQQTIVHELVHALDDQHFELHRPDYDDSKDEIALGFTAVVEGDARRVENAWLSEQSEDFQAAAEREEAAFAEGIDPTAFPEILLFSVAAPYQFGEMFVERLAVSGGERAVDGALTDPPDTSEQFMFPGLYERREPRTEVPVPPADGEVLDDGVVGALFLTGLLSLSGSPVDQSEAVRAVEGWGGDWAVTWTEGEQACIRADFVGDTPDDTAELESALGTWADERDAAQVSMVDDRVRLESCGATAGAVPPQV